MKNRPRPYRSNPIRFFVLFLASMVVFGNQYAFNNPQALQDSMELDLNIGETQYQLFYTVFAFPNIFATFIIGFLIDYLGVRIGLIALTIGVTLSQLIIAFGGYFYSYGTILIGRGLFGLASQSLITAQACLVSFWFKGRELAFALGVAITFPELGNALNSYLSPMIYESTNSLGAPLMASVLLCIISLFCALGAAYLDKKADQQDKLNTPSQIQGTESQNDEQEGHVNIKDVKMLRKSFWLIVILCMFAVSLYVPFMDGANRLYQIRFCFTQVTSGKALVITYLVASVFSAPLGYAIDKIGYKRYFIIATFAIFLLAQIFILVYPQCSLLQENGSVVGLIFIGIGYCFYGNCIISTIPLIVRKKVTGTAFGIMQMVESIALALLPVISGSLVENADTKENGYVRYSVFFVCIGITGLLTSFGLFFIPENLKLILDKTGIQNQKALCEPNGKIIYSNSQVERQDFEMTSNEILPPTAIQLSLQQQLNSSQQ